MICARYESETHEDLLRSWLIKRDLPQDFLFHLPKIGFVVQGFDMCFAAAFLRRCEGDLAIMDSYITNPDALPHLRHQAMDLLTERLIQESKVLLIKKLIGLSEDESIIARSKKHGFNESKYKVLTKVNFWEGESWAS